MVDHPSGRLATSLIACGADPNLVEVEWDDLCKENVLTFSDRTISELSLGRLAGLTLLFPSRFTFATDDLQDAFRALVQKATAATRVVAMVRVQPNYGYGWTDG